MAHRREEKERLRQERLERERAAREAERRKRLVGYGVGGALGLAAAAVVVVLLVAGGGDGDGSGGEGFPSGGNVPEQRITELRPAARAAGCQLRSVRADSRDHVQELSERVRYSTNPPSEGRHYELPAEDGAYTRSPDPKAIVHSLEHGRVVLWFQRNAPDAVKADMKALFDKNQGFQLLLTPNTTRMPYLVAASAWEREPEPLGTGHVLGCPTLRGPTFDALQAFIDEYRGNGPEPVP